MEFGFNDNEWSWYEQRWCHILRFVIHSFCWRYKAIHCLWSQIPLCVAALGKGALMPPLDSRCTQVDSYFALFRCALECCEIWIAMFCRTTISTFDRPPLMTHEIDSLFFWSCHQWTYWLPKIYQRWNWVSVITVQLPDLPQWISHLTLLFFRLHWLASFTWV